MDKMSLDPGFGLMAEAFDGVAIAFLEVCAILTDDTEGAGDDVAK